MVPLLGGEGVIVPDDGGAAASGDDDGEEGAEGLPPVHGGDGDDVPASESPGATPVPPAGGAPLAEPPPSVDGLPQASAEVRTTNGSAGRTGTRRRCIAAGPRKLPLLPAVALAPPDGSRLRRREPRLNRMHRPGQIDGAALRGDASRRVLPQCGRTTRPPPSLSAELRAFRRSRAWYVPCWRPVASRPRDRDAANLKRDLIGPPNRRAILVPIGVPDGKRKRYGERFEPADHGERS